MVGVPKPALSVVDNAESSLPIITHSKMGTRAVLQKSVGIWDGTQ